ncbi:c-type cytochrome [Enterovibrio paralichthyis]|uniref:c-type cytochrome n=1 Tax=Enterovibrio paralichthyis TaxID=2853805 RepID=UPI001C471696|nr:cytochrome c [Enterovibrio paralichthyis]MBV7300465.1 cytochrome c [Enterovibrio paralichthyis]
MRNILVAAGVLLAPLTSSALENAGNAELGQQKAYTCQFCHGATGYAPRPDYPNINGQNAQYLFNAMKAYKTGERSGAMGNMMKQQMSVLNDQDMKDIAAYYAEQNPGKPE